MQRRALVFGATGAIGSAIARRFASADWQVNGVSRTQTPGMLTVGADLSALDGLTDVAAVVWAQGSNRNDSVHDFDAAAQSAMFDANVGFVARSLQRLLQAGALAQPARMCVISSIWQLSARQNKLSYTISKAALSGLVISAAVDLSAHGHLINAVLPGVIDTPMTRAALTPEQVQRVENATPFGKLAKLEDVANAAYFFCSEQNGAITGQSLTVDFGFTTTRIL